ncbi:phenylacetate--CoA ligase family protein [Sedimenticola hydrogenitrophicus]|uniref:phenylacetate--CoA ligase family protein n=1 Tax=Sedimenticola hydrogenitrophicus TaxID=2967975 RepID=UPI0021A7EDF1|nr:phenylacetate--CoA ligase family protein [Sedimenticola hydrogenitrophicus]
MYSYTKMVSNILFPLHERLKQHTSVSVRNSMEQSQWWSSDKLKSLQISKLRSMMSDVYKNVPYYTTLINERGLNPEDVDSVEWVQNLPFLTKSIIKSDTDSFKSKKVCSLKRFNTGGSSGEPLIFYIGKERISHDVAAKWRATRWWDVDIGDPEIVVWGSPVELGSQDYVRAIRDFFLRTHLIPAFEMSQENVDKFIEQIRRIRPAMLFGYPSSLSLIASHAERKCVALDQLGVKVAFVTSERLYDEQRAKIEQAFGCPVANGYGGRDAGFIAHQCPHGGMHITAEDIILEIIGKNDEVLPAGEVGEVVVTHLATSEFPFIRYRTGDVAAIDYQPCACGRGLPLLSELQGRTTDFVVAQDGTVMHGLSLIYILRDTSGIELFQVIQESKNKVTVSIVPGDQYHNENNIEIVRQFKQRLGQGVNVIVNLVENIETEGSGKYRYIKSLENHFG